MSKKQYLAIGSIALLILFSIGNLVMALGASDQIFLAIALQDSQPQVTKALLLTEVLFDPETAVGQVEWIEVYNNSGLQVNLYDYKIGDEETLGGSEGMLRFPTDSTLGPWQSVVVAASALEFAAFYGFDPDYEFKNSGSLVPDMVRYAAWSSGSISLTNGGDEVLILDRLDELSDSLSYGSSEWAFSPAATIVLRGQSLTRLPAFIDSDTALDWIANPIPDPGPVDLSTATATPSATASPTPFGSGLLVSEVYADGSASGEWFEIYNLTGSELQLAHFKIGDEETLGGGEGMYAFPAGASIGVGDFQVVANDAASFFATYAIWPDYELSDSVPAVPDLEKYSPWATGSVNLADGGDDLLLLDYDDELVDAVSWGGSSFAFEPSASSPEPGASLSRVPADGDSHTAADWQLGPPSPGQVTLTGPTTTPTPASSSTLTATPTVPGETATAGTPSPPPMLSPTPLLSPSPIVGDELALLITEVLYDPVGLEPGAEWFELTNFGGAGSLDGYKVGDEESQGGGEGMYAFPAGANVAAGQVLVVARRADLFLDSYAFYPDYELERCQCR